MFNSCAAVSGKSCGKKKHVTIMNVLLVSACMFSVSVTVVRTPDNYAEYT